MRVPLVDLRAGFDPIRAEVLRAVETALEGMNLFLGPNVQAFEREFAAFCEVEHGVGVGNGTDAIALALRALGVGAGDEVIAPSLTFFATIEAIAHVGAVPVLADVEPGALTLDPARVEELLTPRTRALVPVHLHGRPAEMDPLLEIARARGLSVVEDCAQAHGARYRGRRCGSLGDAAAFSFYFTKNLGAYGEAGFVATPRAEVAEELRLLRNHGHVSKFEHGRVGYNQRLDELQAAILRVKLPRLEEQNRRRATLAADYDRRLAGLDLRPELRRDGREEVHHVYAVQSPRRDALREHLEGRGVGTGIHYKVPGHLQPALASVPHRAGPMPVTEAACAALLSLPMYPELSREQLEHVAGAVREHCGARAPTRASEAR